MGYAQYLNQNFESYVRTKVYLAEDDFELTFEKHNSFFVIYEVALAFTHRRTFRIPSAHRHIESFGFQLDYDDFGMKTKLYPGQLSRIVVALRFVEKFYSNILSSFTPYWASKPKKMLLVKKLLIQVHLRKLIQIVTVLMGL